MLVRFFEFAAQFGVWEGGVAFKINACYAQAHAQIHVKSQDDAVCGGGIHGLHHVHAAVRVALFHVALGDLVGGRHFEVFGHHGAALQLNQLANGVLLGLGEAGEVEFGKFGQGLQGDGEEDDVSLAFVHVNLDVVEQFLVPKGLDGVGDFLAGEGEAVAYRKAAQELDDAGVQVVCAGNQDAANFVLHAGHVVGGGGSHKALGAGFWSSKGVEGQK